MSQQKRMKEIHKRALAQGWNITQGRSHVRWESPTGALVFSAASPSDGNAYKQHLRQMVKHGFVDE